METTLELRIDSLPGGPGIPHVTLRADRRANQDPAQLREDGRYTLTLRCPAALGEPVLAVQGYELQDCKQLRQEDAVSLWKWDPDPNIFRNCFGLTTFRVEFEDGHAFEFQPVEVLATKLKAEHAQSMLEYLWKQSPELLYACFARTSVGGSVGEGSPSIERVLQQAETLTESVERLVLFSSRSATRKRLVEELEVKPLSAGDVIDDRSVHFMLHNLHHASPTPSDASTEVRVQYRVLYFDNVAVMRKSESTDVYENRVIHGLLWTVEKRLVEVGKYLEDVMREIQMRIGAPSLLDDGKYVRFQSVCGYYIHQVARQPLSRINGLLLRIRKCQRRSREIIPAKPVIEVPRLTPTFSVKRPYRDIFRQAHEWYQMGNGLAGVSDFLMGLRTIDRLYEYYCLFSILELAGKEAWRLIEVRRERAQGDSLFDSIADAFVLSHENLGRLELRYEPSIPPVSSGEDFWGFVKVAGSTTESYRPDFMIKWTPSHGSEVVAVLDSKYSTQETMRYRHLPAVALKYLLGIRKKGVVEKIEIDHLCLLGPTSGAAVLWDYHFAGRGLGIRPTMHIARAYPGQDAAGLERWFKNVLIRRSSSTRLTSP